MKNWLARAAATAVRRGKGASGATRWTPWSRWFGRSGPVPERAFQGPGEPYPRHWRTFSEPWPPGAAGDAIDPPLRQAVADLPATWRAVVSAHDIAGRDELDVAAELGLTREEHRTILARARAALRARIDEVLRSGRGR